MKKWFLLCFICCLSAAIAQQEEFSWLVGTWKEEGKNSFEVWKADRAGLRARSYTVDAGGHAITSEEISLVKEEGTFYFIPDVTGPQGPIKFTITSQQTNGFTAENAAHDFPKKITYTLKDHDHLHAVIEGGSKSISFYFIRTE